MATSVINRLGLKFSKVPQWGILTSTFQPAFGLETVRHRGAKHYNPKFKRHRKEKVMKIILPDFNKKYDERNDDEMRAKLKEQGLLPPRPWTEKAFYISCTGGVFEPYVPPEGDGKISIISTAGAKQKLEFLEKKSKSMLAVRKIRSFDEDFDPKSFVNAAQEIYIKAHTHMAAKDKETIQDFITERCYPEMIDNIKNTTIRWKFLNSIEPPRVVHARWTDIIDKDNIFGQVTVRFHTQQQLAIYDRFGRLMHGSEIIAKDVLEYIVFEKHLSNVYGVWRLHDKIIPNWMPPREPGMRTFIKQEGEIDVGLSKEGQEAELQAIEDAKNPKDSKKIEEAKKGDDAPQLATA